MFSSMWVIVLGFNGLLFFIFQECTKGPRVIRARTPDDPYESFGCHSRPDRIWSLNRPNVYSMELKVTIALSRQLSFYVILESY